MLKRNMFTKVIPLAAILTSLWTSSVSADTLAFTLDSGRYITIGGTMSDSYDYCDYDYRYTVEVRAKQNSSSGSSAITWDYIKGFSGSYNAPSGNYVYRDVSYVVDRYNDVTYRYDSTWCVEVDTNFNITVGKTLGSSDNGEPYYETVVGKMVTCPFKGSCSSVDGVFLFPE